MSQTVSETFSDDEINQEANRLLETMKEINWTFDICKEIAPVTLAINKLKKEKDVVILAHSYQTPDIIFGISDHKGDSYGLSKAAQEVTQKTILFAGVHFMAETAKILNPNKKVLLPDLEAGCSLASSCPPEKFKKFIDEHPDHVVVTYVNCSAEIKTMSDIVCTSSNAEKIIESIPADRKIIFAPDKNLGRYIQEKTGRDLLLWDGACTVHEAFSIDKLLALYKEHPNAKIIAHPESEKHILDVASFIGSTAQMITHVKSQPNEEYIVATEVGLLHKMQLQAPDTTLIPAPAKEDNTCACSECGFMKLNTLEKLRDCLRDETPEIIIDESIREKALAPILEMLKYQ